MDDFLKHNSTIPIASAVTVASTANIINYAKYKKISHQSHIVFAGGMASALVSGFLNYKKFKNAEVSKIKAIKATIKETTQGSIASISTTSSAKYYANSNYLGMMASIGLGVAGIALLEKVSLKVKINK